MPRLPVPSLQSERPPRLAEHVADQARRAGDGLQVDEAGAGDLVALVAAVAVAEELVAAADGEERGAVAFAQGQPLVPLQEPLDIPGLVALRYAEFSVSPLRARMG